MKRIIGMVVCTFFVFAFMISASLSVSAENVDNLTFELNEEGASYSVTACSESAEGEVIVPEKYNDLPVTTVGNYAFYDCDYITSISLPETINNIEHHAFYSCSKLVSINIPASVKKIGEYAFSDTKINTINIPEGIESIEECTFYGCSELLSVNIPSTIKSIEKNAFYWCYQLKAIELPEGLTEIGTGAFWYCKSIKSIEIPDSVTKIGGRAFCNCYGLESVKLPDGITKIPKYLFDDCTKLQEIIIPKGVKTVEDGAFRYCKRLEKVSIPDTVKRIGANAFASCEALTEINLPDSLTEIGEYAFWCCDSLKAINISENVTDLGKCVFGNCEKLEKISVDSKNKLFASENGVLFNKDKTTLLICPVALPLSKYKIPACVKTIADSAFYGNITLAEVVLPDGLTGIEDNAFYWCEALTKITIPDSVTSLGQSAFGFCKKLKSAELSKNLKSISKSAFYNCTSLTDVTLKKGLKSIGNSAFKGCQKLVSVTVPAGVTRVYYAAFSGCERLEKITLPDTISQIGENVFYNTAYYNTKSNWKSRVLYVGNHLVKARTSLNGAYEIKENTKTIANNAFENCDKVTGIKMPDSLVYIGDYAFYNCQSIEALDIPDNVTSIGYEACSGCYALKSVSLGDRVKSIGGLCFYYCYRLSEITLGKELESIGRSAFYNCDKIYSVLLPDGLTSIDSYAFYDCDGLDSLAIPSTVKEIGKCAVGYLVTCDEGEQVVYSNFEIYGAKGSVAEEYAKKVGVKFIEHPAHNADEWVVVDKSTVYEAGYKYRDCTICGVTLERVHDAQLKCSKPTLKTISNTTSGVKITWSKVKGGDSYKVYRKVNGENWKYLDSTKDGYFTDKTAKTGTTYYYTVRAKNEAGLSSYNTKGLSIKYVAAPKLTKIQNIKGALQITWSKVSGADGYYVYRKVYGEKSWSRIATIKSGSTVSYKDTKVSSGKVYVYTVKAYVGSAKSAHNSTGIKLRYLATPTLKSVTSTTSGVKFTWSKVTGAEGYYVYRKTTGGWKRIATVKGNTKVTYLDKTAKKGTTYTYTVKAFKGTTYSYYNTKGLTIKDKY